MLLVLKYHPPRPLLAAFFRYIFDSQSKHIYSFTQALHLLTALSDATMSDYRAMSVVQVQEIFPDREEEQSEPNLARVFSLPAALRRKTSVKFESIRVRKHFSLPSLPFRRAWPFRKSRSDMRASNSRTQSQDVLAANHSANRPPIAFPVGVMPELYGGEIEDPSPVQSGDVSEWRQWLEDTWREQSQESCRLDAERRAAMQTYNLNEPDRPIRRSTSAIRAASETSIAPGDEDETDDVIRSSSADEVRSRSYISAPTIGSYRTCRSRRSVSFAPAPIPALPPPPPPLTFSANVTPPTSQPTTPRAFHRSSSIGATLSQALSSLAKKRNSSGTSASSLENASVMAANCEKFQRRNGGETQLWVRSHEHPEGYRRGQGFVSQFRDSVELARTKAGRATTW